jgi:hypothetical protein
VAFRDLVFDVGDRVRAYGRFVVAADGDWFDVGQVRDMRMHPADWHANHSVRLIGADRTAVPTETNDRTAAGCIGVTGVWLGDAIDVEVQTPDRPSPARRLHQRTVPPCPEPPGGWPRGAKDEQLSYDRETLERLHAIVTAVQFRPSSHQVVLVVAAADVEVATEVLTPQLPGRFCVVPSRFTAAEVYRAGEALGAHAREWLLEGWTSHPWVNEAGQPCLNAQLFRVTPELAAWADGLPVGLLTLYPGIVPA